jgi:hypothetical protein
MPAAALVLPLAHWSRAGLAPRPQALPVPAAALVLYTYWLLALAGEPDAIFLIKLFEARHDRTTKFYKIVA